MMGLRQGVNGDERHLFMNGPLPGKRQRPRPLPDTHTRPAPVFLSLSPHALSTHAQTKARLLNAERQIKNLEWENEVLSQRFSKVQTERDELYGKFEASIYDVQQKTGLKSALLEKKVGGGGGGGGGEGGGRRKGRREEEEEEERGGDGDTSPRLQRCPPLFAVAATSTHISTGLCAF